MWWLCSRMWVVLGVRAREIQWRPETRHGRPSVRGFGSLSPTHSTCRREESRAQASCPKPTQTSRLSSVPFCPQTHPCDILFTLSLRLVATATICWSLLICHFFLSGHQVYVKRSLGDFAHHQWLLSRLAQRWQICPAYI